MAPSSMLIWDEIVEKLLPGVCIFEWVKVPSHVDILGNEEADKLAKRGKQLSPLDLTVRHQVRQPITPPPRAPWKFAETGC